MSLTWFAHLAHIRVITLRGRTKAEAVSKTGQFK